MGRKTDKEIVTDYATNWGVDEEGFFMSLDLVNWYEKQKKSILLTINVIANDAGTSRYLEQVKAGVNWLMKDTILLLMSENENLRKMDILVQRDEPFMFKFMMRDTSSKIDFSIKIRAVLMGEDNDNDMLIHLSEFLDMLMDDRRNRNRK